VIHLDSALAGFAGTDTNSIPNGIGKDFPIPDFARTGSFDDDLGDLVDPIIGDDQLNFCFREQIDVQFRVPIFSLLSFLQPETDCFGDRHSLDPQLSQGIFQVQNRTRPQDTFYLSHVCTALSFVSIDNDMSDRHIAISPDEPAPDSETFGRVDFCNGRVISKRYFINLNRQDGHVIITAAFVELSDQLGQSVFSGPLLQKE